MLTDRPPHSEPLQTEFLQCDLRPPPTIGSQATSPLRKGETVQVNRLAKEEACENDMLVQIQWQGRKMAVPLSQLAAIDPHESTEEAIGDWHDWVAQGYLF